MRRILFAAVLLSASSAAAHERPLIHQTQAPGHNPAECYCRAQGKLFSMGQTICLRTAQGGRMAECRMEINVMSWGLTDRSCPES